MKRKRSFRQHQLLAFEYTLNESSPALFLDMRLGKTLVTIRRIKLYKPLSPRRDLRVLIVAPGSALGSWEEELIKEGYGKDYVVLEGNKAERLNKLNSDAIWFLINKEGCAAAERPKDDNGIKRGPSEEARDFEWALASVQWDAVVLDESTFIKNPKAKVTRYFLKNFRKVPHRWILTGLPNPESDLDYSCQFLFLDGEFLGLDNYWKVRQVYYEPARFPLHSWQPKPGTKTITSNHVGNRAFIMRRHEANLGPEKITECRYLELSPGVRKAYDQAEKDFMLEYDERTETTIWNVAKYTWLRQLCGGWYKREKLIWDGKVKELKALLTGELKCEQVVVWFCYNPEIQSALKILGKESVGVIKGGMTREMRERHRKWFQAGKLRILLIQQAVAQMGMNLSAADTAIYYSLPPGLQAKKQTEDRILSMDKINPLLYINLLVKESTDTDMHFALSQKSLNSDLSLTEALKHQMERRIANASR